MIRQKSPLRVKAKKTYVAFVLDRSSSMEPLRDATISTFNEQIDEHRKQGKKGGQTSLSLVQFSGNVEETFFNVPIDEIEGKLDRSQYDPVGSTSLYDAIGHTVSKLQKYDETGDVAFLVIILSDGEENTSRRYRANDIASLRKELEDTGRWTFQYIGCDPNGLEQAKTVGFKSYHFSNTAKGMNALSNDMLRGTTVFYANRAVGNTNLGNAAFLDNTSTASEVSWNNTTNSSLNSDALQKAVDDMKKGIKNPQ